jgi:magnesium-transporting ATPase (P-type)
VTLHELASPPEPWLCDAGAVADALGSDVRNGLGEDEAAARLARYGPNQLQAAEPVPKWRRFLEQFADPLVYLLIAAVIVSLVAWALEGAHEVPFDAIVIVLIIVANAVLGYVQEARAEEAVAALQRMAAASAGVVRGGHEQRVPVTDVVPGDVLTLAEGDAVPADARLTEAAALKVAEASLTGESEAVLKDATTLAEPAGLGDRLDMVFSGTAVASGRGRAVVTATGMDTEMGTIARLLGSTEDEPTPLQREVAYIGRYLGIAVVIIALVVMVGIFLTSDIEDASDAVEVLLVGVSLAVAAVPEGLPAVLSVVLALGVQRMAKRQAIVKRLSSVETLGSASVVCSDKTGTLTRNEMTILKVVTASGEVDLSGTGYSPEGEVSRDGRALGSEPGDEGLADEVRYVLAGGSLANDAVLRREDDQWSVQGDPTEAAFLVAERKFGITEDREARFERVGEIPFTSERKLMSTFQADADAGGRVAVVTKGAPDVLLARCTHERVAGEVRALTSERRRAVLADVDRLAGEALRTLAVRLPAAARRAHPARRPGGRGPRARAGLRRRGRDHRPAPLGGGDGHRRGPRRGRARDDDHRRPPRHRVPHRRRPRDSGAGRPHAQRHRAGGAGRRGLPPGRGGGVGVRPGRARAQAAHRGRPPGRGRHRGHDRRRRERLPRPAAGRHRCGHGHHRHRRHEGSGRHDPGRRQLRHDRPRGGGRPGDLLQHPQVPALPPVLQHRRGHDHVPGGGRRGRPRPDRHGEAVAVPLLATQILWINLLTDTAPALAMGVDPPPDDVMERPPRGLHDRIIDREMQLDVGFVGLVMALVTLVALDLRLPGGSSTAAATSWRPAPWRSRRSCWPSSTTPSTPGPAG